MMQVYNRNQGPKVIFKVHNIVMRVEITATKTRRKNLAHILKFRHYPLYSNPDRNLSCKNHVRPRFILSCKSPCQSKQPIPPFKLSSLAMKGRLLLLPREYQQLLELQLLLLSAFLVFWTVNLPAGMSVAAALPSAATVDCQFLLFSQDFLLRFVIKQPFRKRKL